LADKPVFCIREPETNMLEFLPDSNLHPLIVWGSMGYAALHLILHIELSIEVRIKTRTLVNTVIRLSLRKKILPNRLNLFPEAPLINITAVDRPRTNAGGSKLTAVKI
jgi:hypothetical protein